MSDINVEKVHFIEQNPKDLYSNGVEILLKLLNNIIKEPETSKYRKFRATNKVIEQKLLSLNGMHELLLSIGFQQLNEEYILPSDILIKKVKKYRDFIQERLQAVQKSELISKPSTSSTNQDDAAKTQTTISVKKKIKLIKIKPQKSYLERISFPRVLTTKNNFLLSIEHSSDHVMQYEDKNLLLQGKSLIPVEKLTCKALTKLRQIQKAIISGTFKEAEPCLKDLLLIELVNWFNIIFFDWITKLSCKVCGNEIRNQKNDSQNGIRVELGTCCGQESRFYRYNDITQLLRTRKGRCGEYANCFTFFCRCLNYDARLVVATFDHVWTEVYSVAQKRWIHIDPSDNVIDVPLMYQHGWGRKIDYVFACSKDDIQDVTWRYTSNHKDTLLLRERCCEQEMLYAFNLIRKKRQIGLSEARIKYINKRYLRELTELMVQRIPTENDKKGRTSGSLSWRQSRGEEHLNNFFIFEANEIEIENKRFNLRYSCAQNKYERYVVANGSVTQIIKTFKSFDSTTFTAKNIFRKVEKDWKMTYLSRLEGARYGEIIWKFDFSKDNLKIKNYTLKFNSKTYETGRVNLVITNLDGSDVINGSKGIIIKASLDGGNGDIAWQHSQLFRQNLNSEEFPFDIHIFFY